MSHVDRCARLEDQDVNIGRETALPLIPALKHVTCRFVLSTSAHAVVPLDKAPVRPAATLCRSTNLPCTRFLLLPCFHMTPWRLLTMHPSLVRYTIYILLAYSPHFSISSCSSVLPTLFSSVPIMLVSAWLPASFDALPSSSRQRLAKSWTCSSSLPSPSSTSAWSSP